MICETCKHRMLVEQQYMDSTIETFYSCQLTIGYDYPLEICINNNYKLYELDNDL